MSNNRCHFIRCFILFLFLFQSCTFYSQPRIKANTTIKITKEWNLEGKTVTLPENIVLSFEGGYISNGVLTGNRTKINGKLDKIFSMVTISGTWEVPTISTSMFQDLSYDNSLCDVLALTNEEIFNEVLIEKGRYYIDIKKESGYGLLIDDKTSLRIDGDIIMRPNPYLAYNIVEIVGNDVSISGRGTIIGDKFTHKGSDGEWGMGILVKGSKNVIISDLTIKDCWGDCIYIGFNAENVIVNKCKLDNGRRQGISITGGTNITISDCVITNINGSLPQYGIDIEPNKECLVGNVIITGCTIKNSFGGLKCWGGAKEATIKSINISNCKVLNCEADYPMIFEVADELSLIDCYVESSFTSPIYIYRIKNAILSSIETKALCLRPILKVDCGKVDISNVRNKIF